jgi:hypothetical protein
METAMSQDTLTKLCEQQTKMTESISVLATALHAQSTPVQVSSAIAPMMKKVLDSRDFAGLSVFNGDEMAFTEWQHQFMCAMASSSEEAKEELDKAAKMEMKDLRRREEENLNRDLQQDLHVRQRRGLGPRARW